MPIKAITKESWERKKLQKGNALEFVEFEQEFQKQVAAHDAATYLDPNHHHEDLQSILERIRSLNRKDDLEGKPIEGEAAEAGEVHPPLSTHDKEKLERLRHRYNTEQTAQQMAKDACKPLKQFIDDHIDNFLETDVKDISQDNKMPLPEKVRKMRETIKGLCLTKPNDAWKSLDDQFLAMGKASNSQDVEVALNNFQHLRASMKVLHETATSCVDEARTAAARRTNLNAAPIMHTCDKPPTDQKLYERLGEIIEQNTNNNIILNKLFDNRLLSFDAIDLVLREICNQASQGGQSRGGASSAKAAAGGATSHQDERTTSYAGGTAGAEMGSFLGKRSAPTMMGDGMHTNMPPGYGAAGDNVCHARWDEQAQMCEYALKNNGRCKYSHPPRARQGPIRHPMPYQQQHQQFQPQQPQMPHAFYQQPPQHPYYQQQQPQFQQLPPQGQQATYQYPPQQYQQQLPHNPQFLQQYQPHQPVSQGQSAAAPPRARTPSPTSPRRRVDTPGGN